MNSPTLSMLIEYNKVGLIPGPKESQEEFLKRADYCLQLKKKIMETMPADIPFSSDDLGPEDIFEEAVEKTKANFDIRPAWLPIFFSNDQLTPWHGGCAWTFQETEDSPVGSLLQMRNQFKEQKVYLGLYHREELMAHEMAHAARMMFQEPQFEEILAYQTADSKFRRYFGPIVQSPGESMFFVIVLMMIFLVDISLLTLGASGAYFKTALWLKLIPFGMVMAALVRLWTRQRTFHACLNHLQNALGKAKGKAVLFRLTDKEIRLFAAQPSAIGSIVKNPSDSSLRWRVISAAYGQD